MGAKKGFALKFLQWFIRGIQFCCSGLILALFSYFLAVASTNDLVIPNWARAVEGISGIGVVYTLAGLLLLCCLAGIAVLSFFAIVMDIAFAGAYIYVAWANRNGMGQCSGRNITSPWFGKGADNATLENIDGLPTFSQMCKMQTAVFAVSIVAIFFFLFSAVMEVFLVRNHRKEKRFGPSPANNYTSGYARKGFFSRFRRNKDATAEDPNTLPAHTTPDAMRPSYNTDTTAVGQDNISNKYGESGYNGQTAYPETGIANTGAYRH